jgi:hypothetical protein
MKLVEVMAVKNAGEDQAVGFVDIRPLVNQTSGNGKSTPHATVFNVPYFRLQGGKNAVIVDPVKGDIGLAVVSDRDISAVKEAKKQANPGSFRRYSIADAVYLGAVLGEAPDQYVTFTASGIKLADKNNNVLEMKSTGISINGLLINQQGQVSGNLPVTGALQLGGSFVNLAGVTYTGDIATTGEVRAGTIGLKSHHHTAQGALAATTVSQP